MNNLNIFWRERTGLSGAPADVQAEWDRRVAPMLSSQSRDWEARFEADELINAWILKNLLKRTGAIYNKELEISESIGKIQGSDSLDGLFKKLEEVKGGDFSEMERRIQKVEDSVKDGNVFLLEKLDGLKRERADADGRILRAVDRVSESQAGEKLTSWLNWKTLACVVALSLIIMAGSAVMGYQAGKMHYENVFIVVPDKHTDKEWK